MDKRILKEIGLTENESLIFLTLAEKGLLSVSELAKYTGLNRPYIYYAVERLIEKGFLSKIPSNNKTKYQATGFDQLIFSEEEKIKLIRGLADELEKINRLEDDIKLDLIKGKYALKTIFKRAINELRKGDVVYSIGVDEEKMEEIEPLYLEKLLNFSKENNIKENAIIKKGARTLDYAKSTEYRFLDSKILGDTAKIIYRNKVIEIIFGQPVYVITISNKKIANSERKKFEIFWEKANKKSASSPNFE